MATFMTPRQVAERWGCTAGTVRRLCASGDLVAMRLGIESWRISVAAVEAYEVARTTTTSAAQPAPAPKREEVRPPVKVDGFSLPADYEPVFPDLWPGHAPAKKKAASGCSRSRP